MKSLRTSLVMLIALVLFLFVVIAFWNTEETETVPENTEGGLTIVHTEIKQHEGVSSEVVTNEGVSDGGVGPISVQIGEVGENTAQQSQNKEETVVIDEKNEAKEYGNMIASLFQVLVSQNSYEQEVFFEIISTTTPENQEEAFDAVPGIAQKYTDFIDSIEGINPPQAFISAHTKLIEAFQGHRDAVAGLYVYKDAGLVPQQVLQNDYTPKVLASNEAYVDLAPVFDKEEVVFTNNDPGYFFTLIMPYVR